MDELVKTFHIDWKLLVAQIINFGIVLFVLWRFALRPLLKVMSKRSGEIEQSLKNAQEIEKRLQEAGESKEQIIIEAKQEAQIIMERVHNDAEKIKELKLQETRQEMEKLAAKAKASLKSEKEKIIKEAKAEVGQLVIAASSKLIGKNLDTETNRQLVKETIKEIEK